MLPIEVLSAFMLTAILLGLSPGPDNIFVLTHSAMSGARAGVMVVLGLCSGLVIHSIAVALGLAALIAASATAFTVIKFAGAGYLLFLAYKAFGAQASGHDDDVPKLSGGQLYRRGFIMNITNPKVAIFFLAFFPQFMKPELGQLPLQATQLGALFIVATFVVFGGIALAAGSLSDLLNRSPKTEVWINRVAGVVFVGLAANIVFSK